MGGSMAYVRDVVATALLVLLLLILFFVVVAYVARHHIRGWAQRSLIEIAGPAMVRSMAPRTALKALLTPIYGDEVGHEHVLLSLLGGAGRDLGGRDTAVSRNASARFRLQSIDAKTCRSESTWTYEFSKIHNNHRLVIFGTHDRDIAQLVTSERVYPLYELWILNSEEELEEFVRILRDTVQIGITYLDGEGVSHVVEPCAQQGEEVRLRQYNQFVRLPEGANPGDLRIVQFDLHDLADADHVVTSIESLTWRASSNANKLGFFVWSPPYPCYVSDVEFDLTELPWDHERLAYMVVSSMAKWYSKSLQREWFLADKPFRLELNSWMMAGQHGLTLLWRPVDGSETPRALPAPRRSPSW